jgi:hypothetical protein
LIGEDTIAAGSYFANASATSAVFAVVIVIVVAIIAAL